MKKSDKINRKFIESWNIDDWEIETDSGYEDIKALHKTIPYLKYIIKTNTGKILNCADTHIIFDKDLNEIFIKDLSINDEICTIDGIEKIVEITNTNTYENMYDFELGDESKNHRYYTNNILSHNTLLVKNIAKILGVPFCICDATTYTETGYVGEDVENCILKLLQAADYDVEKAEVGIVFIDEIDKIAKKTAGTSTTRDVAGEGVQQGLLKIIEGSVVNVPPKGGRKHPEAEYVKVDTKNILFILGGAFVGLKESKEKKLMNVGHLGFNGSGEEPKRELKNSDFTYEPDDMIDYGFIPEFVGRVPITVSLDKLTEKQFIQILLEPKDSIIKQYTKLFKLDGINLTFDDNAIKEIAHRAYEKDIGARGLRSILEKIMNKYMYELPSTNRKSLNITKKIVDASFGK